MHNVVFVMVVSVFALLGCAGGGPAPRSTTTPTDQAHESAAPSLAATTDPATAPPASTEVSIPPVATGGGSTSAPTQGVGGPAGPVFAGELNQFFPPTVAGQAVQVAGPMSASEMEDLDENTLDLIDQLSLDPSAVEVAFGSDGGSTVIMYALRFPGVDSATLDSTYISVQEQAPGTSNFRVVPVAGRNVHAFDTIIGTTYSWVNGDVLLTVYGTEQGALQAIAAMPLPTVALQPGGEVLVDVLVDVTLTGGANAGTYHGETSVGGCSRNALGENQFGVQYTDEANPQGFTSLQLVVEDATEAEAGSTESFFTTVQMGQLFVGPSYEANPGEGQGSGTVTIESASTDVATVHVAATTADGVGIDATITCNVIFGMGG